MFCLLHPCEGVLSPELDVVHGIARAGLTQCDVIKEGPDHFRYWTHNAGVEGATSGSPAPETVG